MLDRSKSCTPAGLYRPMTPVPLFPSEGPRTGVQMLLAPTSFPASPPYNRAPRVQTSHPPQAGPFGSGLPSAQLRAAPARLAVGGPLPGPSPALDYLTSGSCSAFSAALSMRSMALPPAAGPRKRTGLSGHSQLVQTVSGRGRPRRKRRQAQGGGTLCACAARCGDASFGGRRRSRDLPAGVPRRAPRWGHPLVEKQSG